MQSFKNEEDLLQTATTHIAQLCAENMLLWAQYIETVTLNEQVTYLIAKEHHTQRVCEIQKLHSTNIISKSVCYKKSKSYFYSSLNIKHMQD